MANVITNLRNSQQSFQVLESAARTANPDSQEFEGLARHRGLALVVDVTAASGTSPSLEVKLEGVDRASGKAWEIGTVTATAVSTKVLRVHPAMTAATDKVNDVLPPVIRVSSAITGTTPSFTYSVNGHLTY